MNTASLIQAAHAALESGDLDEAYRLTMEADESEHPSASETTSLRHRIAARRAELPPAEPEAEPERPQPVPTPTRQAKRAAASKEE